MHEGYCDKCKAKKPIADAVEEMLKGGRKALKGMCPRCGASMFKILHGAGSAGAPSASQGATSARSRPPKT